MPSLLLWVSPGTGAEYLYWVSSLISQTSIDPCSNSDTSQGLYDTALKESETSRQLAEQLEQEKVETLEEAAWQS